MHPIPVRQHVDRSVQLIYWDGSGVVMAYKRLEEHTFTWPGIKDGLMTLGHAQFEALFCGPRLAARPCRGNANARGHWPAPLGRSTIE